MRKLAYYSILLYLVTSIQTYANDFSDNEKLMKKFRSENLQGKKNIFNKLNKVNVSKNVDLIKFFINEYKNLPSVEGKYLNFPYLKLPAKEKIIVDIKRNIIYIVYDSYDHQKNTDAEKFLDYVRKRKKTYGSRFIAAIDSQLNDAVEKRNIEIVKFKDFADDREIMEKFKSVNYEGKEYILDRLIHRKGKKSKAPELIRFLIKEYKKLPIIPNKYRSVYHGDIPDKEKQIGKVKIPIILIVRESYKHGSNKDAKQFIKDVRQRKEAYVSMIFNTIDIEKKREEEYKKFEKQKKELQKLSDEKLIDCYMGVIPGEEQSRLFRIAVLGAIAHRLPDFKINNEGKRAEIIKSIKKYIFKEKDYSIIEGFLRSFRSFYNDEKDLKPFLVQLLNDKNCSLRLKKSIKQHYMYLLQ